MSRQPVEPSRYDDLQRRLTESEERFQVTFEQDAVGIAHLSPDGRFLRVNSRLCEFLGYTREELLDLGVPDITHPNDLELSVTRIGQVLSGELQMFSIEKRYRFKDGDYVWGHLTVSLLRDAEGRPKYFVAVIEDVTRHRELKGTLRDAQAGLHRQFSELDQLYDHSPLGLCLMSPELRYLRINKALAAINGWPVNDHIGKTLAEMIPTIAQQVEAKYQHVMDTGEPVLELEVHGVTPADPGTERDWLASLYPVKTADGSLLGVGTVVLEVTDRKRAERAALEAERKLAEQRRRETERVESELANVRDELVRKTRLAAIGQVSASVAHDLRNPLGSVRNAVFMLRRRPNTPDYEERLQKYLEIIDDEVGRADRIIKNLMSMTQKREPRREPVDLGPLVRRVVDDTSGANRLRLRLELEIEPFIVSADPSQLQQVIGNIVANAVQAMAGNGELVITAGRRDDGDTITIRDTGPGIDPVIRDRLFEPLVTTKAAGTGLGLNICRRIIEGHKGRLELLDSTGPGAQFRISLPREPNG